MRYLFVLLWWLPAVVYGQKSASTADVHTYYNIVSQYSPRRLLTMGDSLVRRCNEPDSAIVCYTALINKYKYPTTNEELDYVAKAWHGKWYAYFFHYFDYAKSKECIVEYQKICEKLGSDMSTVYMMYGAMYETIADQADDDSLKSDAARYYRMAISASKVENSQINAINAFINLVTLCSGQTNLLDIGKEYETMKSVVKDSANSFYCHCAELVFRYSTAKVQGDYEKALAINQQFIDLIPAGMEFTRYRLFGYTDRGQIYGKMHRYQEAVECASLVAQTSERMNIKDGMLLGYFHLANYYSELGDEEKSMEYKYKNLTLKDSLLNYRQLTSVKEMSFLSEMKSVEDHLAAMERLHHQWMALLFFVCCIAFVVAVALVVVRRKNKRLRENNEMLYEKNQEMLRRDEESRQKYKNSSLDDNTKEEMMARIRSSVENTDELFSSEFTIDRLSELVGMKSKQVSQVVNEVYGSNFNAFINEYRIKEACRQMSDVKGVDNLTIEGLGNSVGFKSRNSFISAFKKFTGLLPSEYQRIARERVASGTSAANITANVE